MTKPSGFRTTRRTMLAGMAGLGAVAALPGQTVFGQSTHTVTTGIIGNTVEYYPIFVGQAEGMFEEEGVELDLVTTGSSANSAQMVAAEAIHIGSSSWLDAVRAIAGGAPLVIIANKLVRATTMMLSAPDITSVEQLKGKRVSVGGAKDITMVWWAALAKQHGLHPTEDVEVVFGGGTPARFGALAGGAVQAAAVATPLAFTAMADGYNNLGVLGPLLPDVPYMAWHAGQKWADENPEAVTSFVRANNRAIDFIYDAANKERAIEILATSSNVSIEEARQTHELIVEINGFNRGSDFTDEDVRGVVALLAEWGDVEADRPVEDFADRRFVTAAQQ